MFAQWWAQAVAPRRLVIRLLPTAGTGVLVGAVAVNVVLGVLPVGFVIAMSMLIGLVPEAVAGGLDSAGWSGLIRWFLLASALFIGQQVLTPVQTALGELVKRRVDGVVFDGLITHCLRSRGIAPMEDQITLDELKEATSRLEVAGHTPGQACGGLLALIARYLRLAGFVVIVGAVSSWALAAALLVAVMVFRYGQRGGLRRYSLIWHDVTPLVRRTDYLREVATGPAAAKEIRLFGLSRWLADRYEEAALRWLDLLWRERRRIYLRPYLVFTAVGLAIATAVFVRLGIGGATGSVPLTALALGLQATVAAVLLGDHYPESDISSQFGMQSAAALERFRARVEAAEEGLPAADPAHADVRAGSIRFTDVSFRYPGAERDVLEHLDFTLPAGKCTAVVGLNGAGKTTIVKLLTRLYEPTAGAVLVDGVDVRSIPLDRWRDQLSVIFQDFIRYELSAADNVALGTGRVGVDRDAVRWAAQQAGALEFLEALPLGLDTPLARAYTDGVDLSGGQWQRVAIARSLYALRRGAGVLVLDEPTAALDVRAEKEFFDRFVELTQGVTSLLISHRFSTVRRADHIVVVEGGRVVEQGDHDRLVAAGGRYAEMFRLQAERFHADAGGATR